MMIGFADQISNMQLLIGGVLFTVIQFVGFQYVINRLNQTSSDSPDASGDRDAEILGDQPVSSKVGTPRLRRLQPSGKAGEPGTEAPVSEPVPVETIKTISPAEKKPAKPGEPAYADDPYAPLSLAASEKLESKPREAVPVPMLAKTESPAEQTPAAPVPVTAEVKAPEPVPAASDHTPKEGDALVPTGSLILTPEPESKADQTPISLPPLAVDQPPVEPAKETKESAPVDDLPLPVSAIPRRQFVNPFEKPAAKADEKPIPATAEAKPLEPAPVPVLPKIETVGDGIVAVSGPASLEPASKAAEPAGDEESDEVKKRKHPKPAPAEPERAGLILIPPPSKPADVPAEVAAKSEQAAPVDAKAQPPEGALTISPVPSAKPEPAPAAPPATRLVGRPRIFMPANAPAAAALPEEPVSAKSPVSEPETKVEPESEKKAGEPVAEEKPALVEAKTEPAPSAEEIKPPIPPLPTPEPEPVAPAEPVAVVPRAAQPPPIPAPVEPAPAEVPPIPILETVRPEEKAPVAVTDEKPAADESKTMPVPVPPLPQTEPASAPDGALSLTASAPAFSIATPPPVPVMPSTESTTDGVSATGRASAQLTLGFEITSLQLTPFFKLGAVQLRPLSNVVSLHLIGAQPENPLAAGISFQIDRVELDNSHIKSIHLKLLGGSQPTATPQPKLQVNAVELTQAAEGAPISITPSDQTSTAVQLLATFTIAAMEFTPSFEIGSLRLEPTSNQVMLRLAPSSRPAALDLPPSFDVATVQLGGDAQIASLRLIPGAPKS